MENLIKVSDNIFYTLPGDNDRPACGIVIENGKALLVDAGNSPEHSKNLLFHLNQLGFEKPDWIVLTHWHWDHVFGTSSFDTNIFGHYKTTVKVLDMSFLKWDDKALDMRVEEGEEIPFCRDNIRLELPGRSDFKLTAPNISFDNWLTLSFTKDFKCNIMHVGGDHSADSSVIFVPKDKIMFIGDCLYTSIYTEVAHYTGSKLLEVLSKILKYDVELYLESHSDEPIPKADIFAFASLAEDVVKSKGGYRLERSMFPGKSQNSYIQNILEAWDFFLEYK